MPFEGVKRICELAVYVERVRGHRRKLRTFTSRIDEKNKQNLVSASIYVDDTVVYMRPNGELFQSQRKVQQETALSLKENNLTPT